MNTETANIETGDQLTDLIGKARLVKAPAKRKRSRKAAKAQQQQPKATDKPKANKAQPQEAQAATTAKGSVPADQITDTAIITVLVEANPKKPNTWAEVMFETLMKCDGLSVADYKAMLAKAENLPKGYRAKGELQLALRREWVRLDTPK